MFSNSNVPSKPLFKLHNYYNIITIYIIIIAIIMQVGCDALCLKEGGAYDHTAGHITQLAS